MIILPATKEGEVRRKINEDEFVEDADDEGLVKLKEGRKKSLYSVTFGGYIYICIFYDTWIRKKKMNIIWKTLCVCVGNLVNYDYCISMMMNMKMKMG